MSMIKGLKVGDGGVIKIIRAMQKRSSLSPYQKLKIIGMYRIWI